MRRLNFMAMSLTMGAMIAIGGFSVAYGCPGSAKTAQDCSTTGKSAVLQSPLKPGFKTAVLNVTDMTSNESVDKVAKSLTGINGVDEVATSIADGSVMVAYDPSKAKPEQFVPAVTKAGYEAKLAVMEDKAMTAKAADMGAKEGGSCASKAEAMAPGR